MPDDIAFALIPSRHQPTGNLELRCCRRIRRTRIQGLAGAGLGGPWRRLQQELILLPRRGTAVIEARLLDRHSSSRPRSRPATPAPRLPSHRRAGTPVGAENLVHLTRPGMYSWISPPRRSTRRTRASAAGAGGRDGSPRRCLAECPVGPMLVVVRHIARQGGDLQMSSRSSIRPAAHGAPCPPIARRRRSRAALVPASAGSRCPRRRRSHRRLVCTSRPGRG